MSTAIVVAVGSSSRSNSNRFGPSSTFKLVTPVMLPPGLSRLVTNPISTGSVRRREDDWNARRRRLGCHCRRGAAARHDYVHLTMNQFGCKSGKSVVLIIRPAIFNGDVLTFDIA